MCCGPAPHHKPFHWGRHQHFLTWDTPLNVPTPPTSPRHRPPERCGEAGTNRSYREISIHGYPFLRSSIGFRPWAALCPRGACHPGPFSRDRFGHEYRVSGYWRGLVVPEIYLTPGCHGGTRYPPATPQPIRPNAPAHHTPLCNGRAESFAAFRSFS